MIKILLILCCFQSLKQYNKPVIAWSESYELSWADFKSKPNHEIDAVALTASGITFRMSIRQSDHEVVSFKANIQAHFYPEKSWYKKDRADAHTLAHEQLHFDITELFVRKFRQRIEDVKVSNQVRERLKSIHNEINKEVSEMQNKYDLETNHSRNIEAQAKWHAFIAQELEKVSKYKSAD